MNKKKFMERALEISLKANVSPNPFVGCIIVKNKKIIGEGFYEKNAGKHAEINALNKAGKKAVNAEMFVSLEPCSHYGRTPPCTKAIIQSGIKKVAVALKDPNPLVNGKGINELKKAGIKVETGLLEKKAKKINEAYIKFQKTRKPFVVLKAAVSLDGKIALKNFDSKWISSLESRKLVHALRSKIDAVLIGENTAKKDNPKLTSRIPKSRNPLRIIVCSKKISSSLNVFSDKNFLIAGTDKKLFPEKKFKEKVIEIKGKNNSVDLKKLLIELGKRNISSVLVEGGSQIFTSFLKEKLADKLMFFISPKIFGNDAVPVFGQLETKKISKSIQLKNPVFCKSGSDILFEAYLNR